MPSAQKARYGEEHDRGPPAPYYSDHFLPTLRAPVPPQEPSTSGYFRLVQSSNWASASSGIHATSSMPLNSQDAMDEADHRVDRKKQLARRQLMGGLTTPHLPPQSELPRRTHSFIVRSDLVESGHESIRVNADTFRRQRHSLSQPRRLASQVYRSAVEGNRDDQNDRRTHHVIHTWNELVQELNRRKQLLQLDNLDHLAILSDKASIDSSGFSKKDHTVHRDTHTVHRDTHTNGHSSNVNTVLKFADDGLGVTRYRPITPRFLAGLDKKKLPSRTLTQLWVNKLPDNLRSYHVTRPKTTLTYDEVTNFDKYNG